MVTKKYAHKLNILIINQNISARSELKTMLANLDQSEVTLMKDGRDLVGREQSFKYDLIFIREDLDYNLGGADLIRYLTRTNLVPKWCKFVVITDNPQDCHSSPIFRHLRTEVMGSQINYQMLKNIVDVTIQSLRIFKELLKSLNHLPAGVLIKKLSAINPNSFQTRHQDELLELKIKLLMQGRRADLAWNMSEKISYEDDKYREQLFISFQSGDKEKFMHTLEQAERCGLLVRGCAYYRTYHAMIHEEIERALRHFEQIDETELHPNEIESYALLLLKSQGLSKAIEYLNRKLQLKTESCDLKNMINLAQIKCYLSALMLEDLEGQSKDSVLAIIDDIIANNSWAKGSYRYNMYKPFIQVCLAVMKSQKVSLHFEKLYRYRHQLDVTQISLLLYVAHKLNKLTYAKELHKLLERNEARLEISPELISHHILSKDIQQSTMNSDRIKERSRELGQAQEEAGRLFRSLKKFYFATFATGAGDEDKLKMLSLMKRLNINQYWDLKPVQLLSDLEQNSLNSAQKDELSELQAAC